MTGDAAPALAIERSLCLSLYAAANATVQLYRDLLAPWGISYPQMLVLAVLAEEPRTTPGRIAEVLMLDASSVAGLLGRLEAAGLVTREIDPADRRRIVVTATDRAQEIAGHHAWLERCIADAIGLDPDAAADLTASLGRLRASMLDFDRDAAVAALG